MEFKKEDKIRKDYAGIAHPEQIEATIQYWREFLDSVIHQAKEEQREEDAKIAENLFAYTDDAQTGNSISDAIRNKL